MFLMSTVSLVVFKIEQEFFRPFKEARGFYSKINKQDVFMRAKKQENLYDIKKQ